MPPNQSQEMLMAQLAILPKRAVHRAAARVHPVHSPAHLVHRINLRRHTRLFYAVILVFALKAKLSQLLMLHCHVLNIFRENLFTFNVRDFYNVR